MIIVTHAHTGRWLHAELQDRKRNLAAQRTRFSDKIESKLASRLAGVAWDSAKLLGLGLSPEVKFDDAFHITRVDVKQSMYVSFCSGMIPMLRMALQPDCRPLDSNDSVMVEAALKEFHDWIVVHGHGDRERQKLLRNLGVVELLVEILQQPFKPFNPTPAAIELKDLLKPQYRSVRNLLNAVYAVLQAFLMGKSRKNELYIARHIAFFQTQVGGVLRTETMYTELLKDNDKILEHMRPEDMKPFVKLLEEDKNSDYLEFLAALCVSCDVPLCDNQNEICVQLFENPEHTSTFLFPTRMDSDKTVRVFLSDTAMLESKEAALAAAAARASPNSKTLSRVAARHMSESGLRPTAAGGSWVPIREVAHPDREGSRPYRFLLAQLDLCASLCWGRNEHCVAILSKVYTFDECFACAQDNMLPPALRANYVSLILHLFVDVGKNIDVLENIRYNWIWDDVQPFSNQVGYREFCCLFISMFTYVCVCVCVSVCPSVSANLSAC